MSPTTRTLIFTDLDGTLLDHNDYSFEAALPTIDYLNQANIPWILNTSKTLAELRDLAKALGNRHPLILENGGGIAVPETYPVPEGTPHSIPTNTGDYRLIALGAERSFILSMLEPLRRSFRFQGFHSMTEAEVVALTGLNPIQARQARERHFSEPLVWQDEPEALKDFGAELATHSLSLLRGGRFVHVLGQVDKGQAMVRVVDHWFSDTATGCEGALVTIALGDSDNDRAMLEAADHAIVIRSPVHAPPRINHPNPRISTQTGPQGWAESLSRVLNELGYITVNAMEAL